MKSETMTDGQLKRCRATLNHLQENQPGGTLTEEFWQLYHEVLRLRSENETLNSKLQTARADADSREQAAKWAGMTEAQKDEAIRQAAR